MDLDITGGHGECCRLCAARSQLIPVLQVKNGTNLQELVLKHLNLTILEADILPTRMCADCEEKVVTFHEYFEACIRVQDWLTKWTLNGSVPNDTLVKNELDVEDLFVAPIITDNVSMEDENKLKNEIKLETSYLSCQLPEHSFQDDDYPEFDPSTIPIVTMSKVTKKVTKRKSRAKSKSVKEEPNRKRSDVNMSDYINFTCSVCKKDCHSWYRLKSHSMQAHNVQPVVQCIRCNITLQSKTVMYKHVADHKSPSIFTCNLCPKITKSAIAMENHKMRHVPKAERSYKCNMCPKVLKTNESLKSHCSSHIPLEERKKYPCSVCDLKFTTKSAAVGHKRVVHDRIKPYVCDLCGYTCATAHELRQHRAIHSEEKLFVCNVCSKPFKTDSNLRTHMDTHENTSYHCSVCSKVLNTRRTFRKHLLVHETQRKHVCSFCKVAFKRRQTLKVHLNSHTGDKPIACKWCDERFMYAASYRTHKQRRHPDKLLQAHITKELAQHANTLNAIGADSIGPGAARDPPMLLSVRLSPPNI